MNVGTVQETDTDNRTFHGIQILNTKWCDIVYANLLFTTSTPHNNHFMHQTVAKRQKTHMSIKPEIEERNNKCGKIKKYFLLFTVGNKNGELYSSLEYKYFPNSI